MPNSWEVSLSGCTVTREGSKKIVVKFPFRVLALYAVEEVERDQWAEALLRASSSVSSIPSQYRCFPVFFFGWTGGFG